MQKNNASANEAEQRAAIVAAARSWIGTPYHNCADVKGVGVDCGMLLVRVFVDTGLCEPFDPRPYPPDWHLHRSEEKYLGFVFDRAHEVFPDQAPSAAGCDRASTPVNGLLPAPREALKKVQPGDVAVFRFGRCYSHGGIVVDTEPLSIVHAFVQARCVLEERMRESAVLNEPQRAPRFFSLWH